MSLAAGTQRQAAPATPALPRKGLWRRLAALFSQDPLLWLLLILAAAPLLSFALRQKVLPPGDTFNFIFVARDFTQFTFTLDGKRMPLYSFLIAWGLPFFDPVFWAQAVSLAAAVGCFPLLYLLGRELGLSQRALYLAILLLGVNAQFIANVIRPLSDSLYAFMVLLSLYLFLKVQGLRSALVLGLALGLSAMTRMEGFVLAGVLLPWLLLRRSLGILAGALLTFSLVISPWLIKNTVDHGTPLASGYFLEAGTPNYGTDDVNQFVANLQAATETAWGGRFQVFWKRISQLWERVSSGQVEFQAPKDWRESLDWVGFGLRLLFSAAGLAALWLVAKGRAGPLVTYLAVHLILISWWFPFANTPYSRYIVPLSPLMVLLVGAGLDLLTKARPRAALGLRLWQRGAFLGTALLVFVLSGVPSLISVNQRISRDNQRDYTLLEAVRHVSAQEGRVAFASDYTVALAYLGQAEHSYPYRGVYLEFAGSPGEQWQALRTQGVRYLVRFSGDKTPPTLMEAPAYQQYFQLEQRFERGESERTRNSAEVYQVRAEMVP